MSKFLFLSVLLLNYFNNIFSNPLEFSKVLVEGDTCYAKVYPKKKGDHHSPSVYYSRCYNQCKRNAKIEKESTENNQHEEGEDGEVKKKVHFAYDTDKLHKCNMECMQSTRNNIKIFCLQAKDEDEEHLHYNPHDGVHDDL